MKLSSLAGLTPYFLSVGGRWLYLCYRATRLALIASNAA